MTRGKRSLRSRFGFLCQFQPRALPRRFVARFDVLHRAGDVENVAAPLLRLCDKAQGVPAEGMIGKEKVEHKRSSTSSSFRLGVCQKMRRDKRLQTCRWPVISKS